VALNGARSLFLVVNDGGNGFSCDWADWIDPRLTGPAGELKLTDLKWKRAESQWGQVSINRSAGGDDLRVAGNKIGNGIGTHANSVIEFEVPAGYAHFKAQGGLDSGGTGQAGGSATSVRFLVYTQAPPAIGPGSADDDASRGPATALANLDVHPEVEASLFAAEPMLLSPSSIDIDHRGRVWVCEVVNYRGHNGKRSEGDRILILEDTDGDGAADQETVFYQGRDIDSAHGICVIGKQVIVSAGPHVLCFTDEDGDDRPDQKTVWFSGISGAQHDHGIHAFTFGTDGKLYFNFGNEGRQLMDAQGRAIVDLAGNEVNDQRRPYQQGMVFRCNPDLSDVETLGWNFRNNWMVTVDSFGTIWQSDNDDDGNRSVRINYVMEFGNYGYRDEMTGSGWNTERTGMEAEISDRHWHLNDPGVVPNLLLTGAGAPTGITVYEGDALPSQFHGQLIHCDAGPSVTRAYVVADQGAGYGAEIVNLLQGARDPWFRPSDVKIAPDGSLIVADWYDPGVGGHAMGDLNRGRIFRVTAKGQSGKYQMPKFDFTTASGAVAALQNPNLATRYLAWTALHQLGTAAEPELIKLSQSDSPVARARALWLLGKIPGRGLHYVETATLDRDPRIRMLGIRLARQLSDVDELTIAARLARDPSPQVRRECALAVRHQRDARAAEIWAILAAQHDGHDRWYLEALGIGADGQWDSFLAKWLTMASNNWNTPAGRDLIWRSRATDTPTLLAQIIRDANTSRAQTTRYLRALDFVSGPARDQVVLGLAFDTELAQSDVAKAVDVRAAALERLPAELVRDNPARRQQIDEFLNSVAGSQTYLDLVERFDLSDRYDQVLQLAVDKADESLGIESIRLLLAKNETDRIGQFARSAPADQQLRVVEVLGRSADNRAVAALQSFVGATDVDLELRRAAVKSMARIRDGAQALLTAAEKQELPAELLAAAASELHQAPWQDLHVVALRLFPLAASKDNRPLPVIRDLARGTGTLDRGRQVFQTTGTCAKCHQVRGDGKQVGPDLSEIGGKLSREALFESILYPSAGISHSYETYVAELHDGNVVTGLLVSETDEVVEIKNNEGLVSRLARAEIEHLAKQPVSLMPADLHQSLTEQDLIDVVEYLATLKKP